jgi:hypothetical protein
MRRWKGKARSRPPVIGVVEMMEPRTLLSVSAAVHHKPVPAVHHVTKPVKHPVVKKTHGPAAKPGAVIFGKPSSNPFATPNSGPTPGPPGFEPNQLRHFYNVDSVTFGQIAGDGSGQTIAIIDAYDQSHLLPTTDPNYATSGSDLYEFDQQFGLPDPPSFKIYDEYGTLGRAGGYDFNWAIEESMDVEWAHAMAPKANIILIEAYSTSSSDLLNSSIATAVSLGATVVSMSFTYYDANYNSLFNAPGVTFLASAGDQGSNSYDSPASSKNVVAVGGTTITTSDINGTYSSETTWNDQYGATGGGLSQSQVKPSYQAAYPSSILQNTTQRGIPDVAFDGDPASGAWVLDTPGGGWYRVGGTSLGSPCWAGLIAVADQGRAILGLGSLSGNPTSGIIGTLPRLYSLPSSDFHDITTGNNNTYSAGTGYDLTTGLGTPIASKLIPDLAGGATVTGQVFQDNNADAIYNGNDVALSGKAVYLDLNNLGYQVATDPIAVTNATGNFTFNDVIGGVGTVRLVSVPAGDVQVGNSAVTTAFGSTSTVAVALFPTAFGDSTSNDTYTLRISPTLPTQVQILVNNTLSYLAPTTLASTFSFSFTGSSDSLVVDGGNGNPIPTGGVTFNGGSSGNGNTLSLLGSAGNDTITANATSIVFGGNPINFSNAANLIVDPRGGVDALTVNAGTITVPAQTPGAGFLLRQFSNLTVASGAVVKFLTPAANADRAVIVTSNISINPAGTLDLGGNDMIVHSGVLGTLNSLVGSGFANGSWTGPGIDSSAAHSNPTALTALGTIQNSTDGIHPIYAIFDDQPVVAGDVLIKYTYYGDANLDGRIDGNDYTQVDSGYGSHGSLSGWVNGDFDYSNSVDGSDYSLIDNAFNMQSVQL